MSLGIHEPSKGDALRLPITVNPIAFTHMELSSNSPRPGSAMVPIMEDEPLQRCTARVAAAADLSILKPRKDVPRDEFARICSKS